jgi:hypothetical protein
MLSALLGKPAATPLLVLLLVPLLARLTGAGAVAEFSDILKFGNNVCRAVTTSCRQYRSCWEPVLAKDAKFCAGIFMP